MCECVAYSVDSCVLKFLLHRLWRHERFKAGRHFLQPDDRSTSNSADWKEACGVAMGYYKCSKLVSVSTRTVNVQCFNYGHTVARLVRLSESAWSSPMTPTSAPNHCTGGRCLTGGRSSNSSNWMSRPPKHLFLLINLFIKKVKRENTSIFKWTQSFKLAMFVGRGNCAKPPWLRQSRRTL